MRCLAESEYNKLGEDGSHPLASPMEVIGAQIEGYEDEHAPELKR